mmetsp:Transcript_31453/g.86501  ORF Transcript_31453/g.86501 Transcript_31453/m.86501 type:complete len:237 (+) Transcript_31453:76-786(+)
MRTSAHAGRMPLPMEPPGPPEFERTLNQHKAAKLVDAASRHELGKVKEILRERAHPSCPDQLDRLPLHAACCVGSDVAVKLLLEAHADPKQKQMDGSLALEIAAWQGHVSVTELLLKRSASINARTGNGWTPLVSAAKQGHLAMVQLLLDRKADPEKPAVVAERPQGLTAKKAAEENRRVPVANELSKALSARGGGAVACRKFCVDLLKRASYRCSCLCCEAPKAARKNAAAKGGH